MLDLLCHQICAGESFNDKEWSLGLSRKTNDGLKRVFVGRGTPPGSSATEPDTSRDLPVHLDPRRAPGKRRRPRWSRLGVYAVAVFVVAMGIVTGIELIGQKPVSALMGDSDSSRTKTT